MRSEPIFKSMREAKRYVAARSHVLAWKHVGKGEYCHVEARVVYLADDGTYLQGTGNAIWEYASDFEALDIARRIAQGQAIKQIARALWNAQRSMLFIPVKPAPGYVSAEELRTVLRPLVDLVASRNGNGQEASKA